MDNHQKRDRPTLKSLRGIAKRVTPTRADKVLARALRKLRAAEAAARGKPAGGYKRRIVWITAVDDDGDGGGTHLLTRDLSRAEVTAIIGALEDQIHG